MTCRVCGSERLALFLRCDHVPATIERLVEQHELADEESIDLEIWRCGDCGFVQLRESPLPSDYYRSYDKSTLHSAKAQEYQVMLAAELTSRFSLRDARVLEVGCGDGFFGAALRDHGVDVEAVEPGVPSVLSARARGISVTESYFGTDNPFAPASFDAIVARQVISHIVDLDGFMAAVSRFLKPGGLAIIEAPNVNTAIERRRFFDFFADYSNYFAPETLARLFQRYGCALEEVTARADAEYFIAIFKKASSEKLSDSLDDFTVAVRDFVDREKRLGHRIACWGAGGRGISFLALAGVSPIDIEFVIDTSPLKQGRYLPASHIPVVAPDVLREDPPDCLILTALAYKDEILESLDRQYQFAGSVVVLTPEPQIVTLGTKFEP